MTSRRSRRGRLSGNRVRNDTFIVTIAEGLVRQAKKISFFYWVEKSLGPLSFAAVDAWTIAFLGASLVSFCLVLLIGHRVLQVGILLFSAIRVFEYLNYLLWVILFAKPNKGATDLRSYRRTMLLLMSNYLETIFWFATWLGVLATYDFIEVTQGPIVFSLMRESTMLMVANWSGNIMLKSGIAVGTVALQDLIGLFMTIVVGARVISLLPRPTSADPEENRRKKKF
jgi:hypothetical protein